MIRRLTLSLGAASLALAMAATTAFAGNPAGTGQPSVECGEDLATNILPGFETDGFEVAEEHYAGEGGGSWHADNDRAVSQYDVACYQTAIH